MAEGQELLLTFGYDRKSLNAKVSEMEQIIENAKLSPNITSEMKSELDKTLKEIKSFAKNASKDFAKIEAVNLDSKAFDNYVKKTDGRLDKLETAVSSLIDKLAQIDGSADLSKLGSQFEELKGIIDTTTGAVGELVQTANSVGANLKIVEASESDYDELISKTEKAIKSFKKLQDSTKETKLTQKEYNKALDEYYDSTDKIDDLTNKKNQLPEGDIARLKIAEEINSLMVKRYELAQKILDTESYNPSWLKTYSDDISELLQIEDNGVKEGGKLIIEGLEQRLKSYVELLKNAKRASAESVAEIVSADKLKEKDIQNAGAVNVKARLVVTTTTQSMVDVISAKLAEVQKKLNTEYQLVVPIKYDLRTKAQKEDAKLLSDNAVKSAQKSEETVVDNFDKSYSKISKKALEVAETAAKESIKKIQELFDANGINLKINPISREQIEALKQQLFSKNITKRIEIGKDMAIASQQATELKESLLAVNETLEKQKEIRENLANVDRYKQATTSKADGTKLTSKQIQARAEEDAQKLLDEIQKNVFDKFKFAVHLKLAPSYVKELQDSFDASKSNIFVDNALKNALKKAEDLKLTLNQIAETGIKIDVTDSSKQFDFSKLKGTNLKNVETTLGQILATLSSISGLFSIINSNIKETAEFKLGSKWSEIATAFGKIAGESDKIDLRKQKTEVAELLELYKEYVGLGGKNDFSILTTNQETLSKLQKQANTFIGGREIINNSELESTKDILNKINPIIASLTSSLTTINGLNNVSNVFKSLKLSKEDVNRLVNLPDKLKAIYEASKQLDQLPTTGFIDQLAKISEQAKGLESLATILKTSKKEVQAALKVQQKEPNDAYVGLMEQISEAKELGKIFKTYSKRGTFETSQPKEYAEVLELIQDYLIQIDKIENDHKKDNKSADATIGQIYDTKKVQSMIVCVRQLFDWLDEIKIETKDLNNQLSESVKITEGFKKTYNKIINDGGTNERKYSEEYIQILREIGSLLEEASKYKVELATPETISALDAVNARIETLLKSVSTISTYSNNEALQLEKSINTALNKANFYETRYSQKWGFGAIEENFTSDYSTKLKQIRETLDEIQTIRERAKSGNYLESDLEILQKSNEQLEEFFQQLAKIDTVSKKTQVSNMMDKISKYLTKNTHLTDETRKQLGAYLAELNSGGVITHERLQTIAADFNRIQYTSRLAGREGSNFLDAIRNKLKYGWAQSIAQFFSFYDIVRYIHEVSGTVTELNSNLIELAKVSDTSIGELYANFSDFRDIAKETGGTINDVIKSTADWARNGFSLPESKELARLSSIFQNIGDGLTESQANEYLVSTIKGFNLEAKDALDIMDVINNVSNDAASSVSNIGETLERSSSALGAANTSFSQSVALLTTANEVLQNPETVGGYAPTCTVMYIIKSSYIG